LEQQLAVTISVAAGTSAKRRLGTAIRSSAVW
jgi:hypothetical protein